MALRKPTTNIDKLFPDGSRAWRRARRVCDRLSTTKLAIKADDGRLLFFYFGPPHVIVTDKLRFYSAAMKVVGYADHHSQKLTLSNLLRL